MIEGLSYDARKEQLYWTDTSAHNIYKTLIPSDQKDDMPSERESVHDFGDIVQPRGIAVDYCNE